MAPVPALNHAYKELPHYENRNIYWIPRTYKFHVIIYLFQISSEAIWSYTSFTNDKQISSVIRFLFKIRSESSEQATGLEPANTWVEAKFPYLQGSTRIISFILI